jgi:hypothetical protein
MLSLGNKPTSRCIMRVLHPWRCETRIKQLATCAKGETLRVLCGRHSHHCLINDLFTTWRPHILNAIERCSPPEKRMDRRARSLACAKHLVQKRPGMETAKLYEIRIKGHLDFSWSEWFDGLKIIHEPAGDTLLRGYIIDQPALYGMLARIQGLGLTLLSVNAINEDSPPNEGNGP